LEISEIDTMLLIYSFFTTSTINELENTIYQAQPSSDCDCKWSLSCRMLNEGRCVKDLNGCDATNSGCGLLGLYSCEGQCDEAIVIPEE
jgi:hypothetical protein